MPVLLQYSSHKYNLTSFLGCIKSVQESRTESEILQQKATENPWTNKGSVPLHAN